MPSTSYFAGKDVDARDKRGHDDGITKNQNTGELALRCLLPLGRFYTGNYWFGVVVDFLNSECPQQNRANESKNSAYRQYIQLQGKVHGKCLPC